MSNTAQNALSAKRVGQYLVDAGVLKADQLQEALDRQQRMSKAGFHVLLGTILEEMGAVDRQSLEAVILRQRLDEGSVSLGSEFDWAPFRSTTDAPQASVAASQEEAEQMPAPSAVETASESELPLDLEPSEPGPVSTAAAEETVQTSAEPSTSPSEEDSGAEMVAMEVEAIAGEPEPLQEPEGVGPQHVSLQESPAMEHSIDHTPQEAPPTFGQSFEPAVAADHVATEGSQTPETDEPPSAMEAAMPEPAVATPPMQAANPEAAPQWSPMPAAQSPTEMIEVEGFTFRAGNGVVTGDVAAVIGQLQKRLHSLESQLTEYSDGMAHLESMRRYGEQTIKAADTIAAQIQEEAEQQATAIRDRAQQEARRIIVEAKGEAEQLRAEAQQEHDRVIQEASATAEQMNQAVNSSIERHREVAEEMRRIMEGFRRPSTSWSECGDA